VTSVPGLEAARRIAEELLAPAAGVVEERREIPIGHFDALAEVGLYGAFAPPELGGAGLGPTELWLAIEILAAGCLATTFVLIQHYGLLRNLMAPTAPLPIRDAYLGPVATGALRSGIALGGALADGSVRAEEDGGHWRLSGTSPWVTGWGYLDLLQVAARTHDDRIGLFLLDAGEGGLTVTSQRLTAVDASHTVRLEFSDLRVPTERLLSLRPFDPPAALGEGLRSNGSLSLGLVRRANTMLGDGILQADLDEARRRLDQADRPEMPRARASASLLAVRAATLTAVTAGSSAVGAGSEADRLYREALFTLLFGSRPAIKEALRRQLTP
jgi:alkylation response protein AidB-like acyl-CoA dehydrogenase